MRYILTLWLLLMVRCSFGAIVTVAGGSAVGDGVTLSTIVISNAMNTLMSVNLTNWPSLNNYSWQILFNHQ